MKKILFVLIGMLLLAGCTTEGVDSESLKGTVWVSNFGTTNYPTLVAIEFTGDSAVRSYFVDDYLTDISGTNGRKSGSYTKSGNTVTFNLKIFNIAHDYTCTKGTISGDRMVVTTLQFNSYENKELEETHSFLRKL